jgi:hypothetical protein
MSSVTRFLRQIPTGLSYYTAPAPSQTVIYYTFVPAAGNYVGNYAPGTMTVLSNFSLPSGSILRDMGKTLRAPLTTAPTGDSQHYREFQVIVPTAANADGAFGVIGDTNIPAATAPFYTVYLPVTVGGQGAATAGLFPLAGGQM